MAPNILALRLEGALQSWGNHGSRFVVRETHPAPTKSGVAGLLCAALGVGRRKAADEWLPRIRELQMAVRVDRPGELWWDYHTVGAGQKTRRADGKTKDTTLLSRRQYLADASFLVCLRGDSDTLVQLEQALREPHWPLFLGRKACPPSLPVLEHRRAESAGPSLASNALHCCDDIMDALREIPHASRDKRKRTPALAAYCEWMPGNGAQPPADAEIWYDQPESFDPPIHGPRIVVRSQIPEGLESHRLPPPLKPQGDGDYNRWLKVVRPARLQEDSDLCMLCKGPGTTVHHTHYRSPKGHENTGDLRTLCRICHDAVTMLEYGLGKFIERIDPCDPQWRDKILQKRQEIIKFRSRARGKKAREKYSPTEERAEGGE